jgi:hypothetical protein
MKAVPASLNGEMPASPAKESSAMTHLCGFSTAENDGGHQISFVKCQHRSNLRRPGGSRPPVTMVIVETQRCRASSTSSQEVTRSSRVR